MDADGTVRSFGKCLDIQGNGTANVTKVQLWDCDGAGGQQWVARADGSLYNPQSGRCLDAFANMTGRQTTEDLKSVVRLLRRRRTRDAPRPSDRLS
jgi:hypothetical protein